jgi:hypothetical protein
MTPGGVADVGVPRCAQNVCCTPEIVIAPRNKIRTAKSAAIWSLTQITTVAGDPYPLLQHQPMSWDRR